MEITITVKVDSTKEAEALMKALIEAEAAYRAAIRERLEPPGGGPQPA